MTDREKLVELLGKINSAAYIKIPTESGFSISKYGEGYIADYLIANGVTVRQTQKPLTVESMMYFNWEIWREWWIELKSGRIFCAKEGKGYIHTPKDEYGKTWRCWAEKPTDDERKASEWLK